MNSSETERAEPDLNAEAEENVEAIAEPADPLTQVQADLNAAKAESAEWQDRFLRKAAEFENFRKRTDKEKTESMVLAKSSLLVEFLPVADACERALQSMGNGVEDPGGGLKQYREGVELLFKQLLDTFSRVGVVRIESEGKPFDPHLHEALSRKEDAGLEEDTVAQELRRGYLFKDKLLRPAQVIVAVNPEVKG
jgi:molecular chaperone GrpE